MSVLFHPAVFHQAEQEMEVHLLSQVRFTERIKHQEPQRQKCACRHWLNHVMSDVEIEKHLEKPHSVCLPSMSSTIRIAYWLDLMGTAV